MSLDERVPLDSDVWKIVRLHGIGLEQLDIYSRMKEGVHYLELRWKKHVFKQKRDAIAYDLRREGYTVRMTGKLSNLEDMKRELQKRYDKLNRQGYIDIEVLKPIIENIPDKDKTLYTKLYIGEKHPVYGTRRGLWVAVSLPGGNLWLRWFPTEKDKITILHEYGHYVWYFMLNDEMRRIFKGAYSKVEEWATEEAKKREGERVYYGYTSWKEYFTAERAGRNVSEAYAEAYAWYYGDMRELLKEKKPEIYEALTKVEAKRV